MVLHLPKLGAWLNAFGLSLVITFVINTLNYIVKETRLLELLPVQWDLLVVCLLILSPIWSIAYIHHWINLLLEKSSSERKTKSDPLTGAFPTLVSWWEGMYAWLVINIATCICVSIGGLFIPTHDRHYNILGFLFYIYTMLLDITKFKYLLSGPFIFWMISAAYLYEFQFRIQRYFFRKAN